ncbi:MAG: hypothetical protein JXB00_06200 [Bacteroidales bacterium]|nr:hypothetical protein [Bacteroidales bacterium]
MKTTTLNRLSAGAAFLFALFCILWIVLSYFILPVAEAQGDYSVLVTTPGWTLVSFTGLLASIFGILVVFGIFHASREQGGWLMFTGTVLLFLGLMLEMASLTWEVFIWPVVCASEDHISFVKEAIFTETIQFKSFIVALLGLLFLGNLVTAIALLRIKKYGMVAPVLILAGIVLYIAGNFISMHVSSAGLCIYAIAFVMIGLKLRREE